MFDIAPTELMVVALVALVVIGPKDLPKAMRFVGHWVGKARGVARQFRSGFDTMVREAELAEMEKKWADENARIMREHPTSDTPATGPSAVHPVDAPSPPPPVHDPVHDAVAADPHMDGTHMDGTPAPVMVERPELREGPADQPPAADGKAAS